MTTFLGLGVQTHDPWQWLFVATALGVAGAIALSWLVGPRPRWAEAGLAIGFWSVSTALVGFMWDVAWHADTGRDRELLTVPHTLILLGLFGILVAALVAVLLASHDRAETGWRRGRLRVPYSALPLAAIGVGALVGFPLDDRWHATYGVDVTMWSPTHLLMIGGASLAPIALWLMAAEGQVRRSVLLNGGAVLIGLSTFQLEFDMAIPQWQLLFHPVLVAAAAAIGLTAARAAIGRGGALLAAVGFLAIRALMLLLVGVAFGYTWPRFPLYLGAAVAVELAFAATAKRSPILRGTAAGLGAGTFGLATEWAWNRLWYPMPWGGSVLPHIWMAVLVAVAGGVIGVALGRVLAGRRPGVPAAALLLSLLAIGVLLALHLPARHADGAQGTLALNGTTLTVTLSPADAAAGSDWFAVLSWQGHAPVARHPLREVAPGRYEATGVETGGAWKSMVFLARGDTMEGIPIYMPADPAYRQPAIYATTEPQPFVPSPQLLMREAHGGAPTVLYLASASFLAMIGIWVASLLLACRAYAAQAGVAAESKASPLVTWRGGPAAGEAEGEGAAAPPPARPTVQS
ncbi:MAG TPA: hypothetical protein VF134_01585 [Candidatus Dormibacteraeota bacterium]